MSSTKRVLAGLAAAVLLTACGPTRRSVSIQPAGSSRGGYAAHGVRHGDSYRVARGDTLYGIAFRNGLDYRTLAAWNDIDAPYVIHPGEQLRLVAPRHAAHRTASVAQVRPAPSRAATPAATPRAAVPPPHAVATGASRSSDGVSWSWPTDGRLISGFQVDDAIPGIELAGQAGQPIRAAADGVVVYSGNGLVGYGELIIIKHTDSLLSAYGHNRKRLVREGERVRAGQVIAEMGSTGAPRNELEFQIRRDGNPVDPLKFLPAR